MVSSMVHSPCHRVDYQQNFGRNLPLRDNENVHGRTELINRRYLLVVVLVFQITPGIGNQLQWVVFSPQEHLLLIILTHVFILSSFQEEKVQKNGIERWESAIKHSSTLVLHFVCGRPLQKHWGSYSILLECRMLVFPLSSLTNAGNDLRNLSSTLPSISITKPKSMISNLVRCSDFHYVCIKERKGEEECFVSRRPSRRSVMK